MNVVFSGAGFTMNEECPDLKAAFMFLANCGELFGAATCCENCQGTEIKPRYRKHGDYDFYELVCTACHWSFKFGQRKDDKQLFPKGWEPPYGEDATQPAPEQPAKKQAQSSVPF